MKISATAFLIAALVLAMHAGSAFAAVGSLSYSARVVHNNRGYLSFVHGTIDLARNELHEQVDRSFLLDWKQIPGNFKPTQPALPAIWRVDGQVCQRFGKALPTYDSPLLRHFIVSRVLSSSEQVKPGDTFMSGQLEILTTEFADDGFEIVAAYMGAPLVIVGTRELQAGMYMVKDLAVLGANEELYQYFIDEISWSPGAPSSPLEMPALDPDEYVTFPEGGSGAVAIRPVKEWLVFQAQLPNGRPLNLVFDSGAETMILDDQVLQLDSRLEPVGEMIVAGAFESDKMNLYEGFDFEVGGVKFHNLTVAGTQLTLLGFGAGMRIHGIVGNEILQLCKLDIDLKEGRLYLSQPGGEIPDGERVELTFIHDLPHVEADLHDTGKTLLMLDTGQRSGLQVNIDYLEDYELGDDLVMNGFHGDITGGLLPRYMIEELDVSLGSATYQERVVDAMMVSSYEFNGIPVVGSIGFSMLARHFGGISIDYSQKLMFLRDPAEEHVFVGSPEAWDEPAQYKPLLLASAAEIEVEDQLEPAAVAQIPAAASPDKPVELPAPAIDDPRPAPAAKQPEREPARQGYLRRPDSRPGGRTARGNSPWIYEDPLTGADIFVGAKAESAFLAELAELLGSDIADRARQLASEMDGPTGAGDAPAAAGEEKDPDYPFKRGLPKLKFPPLK